MPEARKCNFMIEDSRQCGAYALVGKELCFNHDPESREAKQEAVTKGGQSKEIEVSEPLTPVEIKVPQDVAKLLIQTISEVRSGELNPKIATTIGFLAGHLLKAFEVGQLANRSEALELALRDSPYKGAVEIER